MRHPLAYRWGDRETRHLAAASVDSMQFAWLTADHNSAVFGQLQPITISVLLELNRGN
jgi:hypothetical protein